MIIQIIAYEDLSKDVYDFFANTPELFTGWDLIPGCTIYECNPNTMDEFYSIVEKIKAFDKNGIQILIDVVPPEKENEPLMMLMHVIKREVDLIF